MKKSLLLIILISMFVISVSSQIINPCCENFRNYAPYPYESDYYTTIQFPDSNSRIDYFKPHYPILNIRMVWHIMLNGGNGPITSVNLNDPTDYMVRFLGNMNGKMSNLANQIKWDLTNPSPNIQDSRIRYGIDANDIYFEQNGESAWNSNFFNTYVDQKAGATDDFKYNCVHIFFFATSYGYNYTSLSFMAPARPYIVIQDLTNLVNIPNWWDLASTTAHELCHGWGLDHITADGGGNCEQEDMDLIEDTPFDNGDLDACTNTYKCDCWNGGCCGNNMMHYNAPRSSLTRYQLGKMHYELINNGGTFGSYGLWNMVMPDYCEITEPTIVISENEIITWKSTKILRGDIEIYNGGQLTIMCKVHMPDDARITVREGGKLIIDGVTRPKKSLQFFS